MKKNRQILVLAALLFGFLCFPADKVLAASNVVEVPLTVKQNFEENSNEKGIDLTGTYEFRALDIGIPMPGDSDNDRHVFVLDGNNAEKMIPIMFIIVVGIIIFSLVRGIITWNKNNQSPRLTVSVVVAAKRENITHHQHANVGDLSSAHGFHTTTSTSYYVTFLVESGDRIELCVSGTEYGMLVEGDTGRLTFQGTRYLSFERI